MDAANLLLAESLLSRTYVQQGQQALKQRQNLVKALLSNRRLPDIGWDDASVELLLQNLSLMDSNNFLDNVGVGEREAKCFSPLVMKRHYGMAHGIGRSGSINDEQPKAGGSTLVAKLCNALVKDALEIAGLKDIGAVTVLPLATGMALMLSMLALRKKRPPTARYVLWPRMDQKSCLKSILAAGLEVVVIPNVLDGDQLRTNLGAIEATIEELGSDHVVCVLSTTSCFATRAPDRVVEIAKLCQRTGIGHIINNAYGVQCAVLCQSVTQAWRRGRVDAVVQSTDKNFLVPVGGAVVAAGSRDCSLVEAVNRLYPGRASMSPLLDVFITLLSMGGAGWKKVLAERGVVYEYLKKRLTEVAEAQGERLLHTPDNPISLAVTLDMLETGPQAAASSEQRTEEASYNAHSSTESQHKEETADETASEKSLREEKRDQHLRVAEHSEQSGKSLMAGSNESDTLAHAALYLGPGGVSSQQAEADREPSRSAADPLDSVRATVEISAPMDEHEKSGDVDVPSTSRSPAERASERTAFPSHPGTASRTERPPMDKAAAKRLTFFGSMLFARCVSGSRVIARGDAKVVEGLSFAGYGSSYDRFPHSYMTAAAAVGTTCHDVDVLIARLERCFVDYRKKQRLGNAS